MVPDLQINIDGLPIYESNNLNFWPVLGHFVNFEYDPFVIGLYCGDKKPESSSDFLTMLIKDWTRKK